MSAVDKINDNINVSEKQIKAIDENSREVLSEMRDRLEVVYEDNTVVVLADSLDQPEANAAADKYSDLDYSDVVSLMWERLPDHIDTGIGSAFEYTHPIVVPLTDSND